MSRSTDRLDYYHRLRAIMRRHHSAVVKTISRTTLRTCAKKLKLLEGGKLVLESESELTILMDYCVYSHQQRGKTAMQRYLAKLPPADDPDEQAVRAAMSQPRFSMFRTERGHRGMGIEVHDLVRGGSLLVVDEALSRTMHKGRVLGGRLIPFSDFWVTTGAAFPMSDETVKVVQRVFLSALKLTEGGLSSLRPEAEEELATVVIGVSLQEGTTSQVSYV